MIQVFDKTKPYINEKTIKGLIEEFEDHPSQILTLLSMLMKDHQRLRIMVAKVLTEKNNHRLLFRCFCRIDERLQKQGKDKKKRALVDLFQGIDLTKGLKRQHNFASVKCQFKC
jgi:hypothetical protein